MKDIVELQEVGLRRANEALKAGFTLLAIEGVNREVPRDKVPTGQSEGATYIQREIRYVFGRRADQPPFPAKQKAAGEQA